jgi:MoaA/NifB/PqqE/SkfB family radical SAM enzyme
LSTTLSERVRAVPGARVAARSRRVRGLARRLGIEPANPRPVAPARPVGAKLELTYACNLRCAFCYTDSPRRTLERTVEMSDDDWRSIVAEVIELGVIEAVVTGGEPLLRRSLALEVVERLDAAGIGVTVNTNGWFVDAAVADRFAAARSGLAVHVSLDGTTPELHDRARGVPGSWRRAVAAIGLLVDRGVSTHLVYVATPENELAAGEVIEQAWSLGADSVRLTPVVPIGAAARGGSWQVSQRRLERTAAQARRRLGQGLEVIVAPQAQTSGPVLAPAYVLVRPNGAVTSGSLSPFRFGDARQAGLAASWERIVRDWDHPEIRAWREPVLRGRPLSELKVVAYRDEELEVGDRLSRGDTARRAVALPRPARSLGAAGTGDRDAARRHVQELALARRYRLGRVRWSEADSGGRYVRVADGRVARLNATAALVMDECADGTAADALARIAELHPARPRPGLERDVLDTVRGLRARGILAPAGPVS